MVPARPEFIRLPINGPCPWTGLTRSKLNELILPSRTLFQRGGALVELVNRDGISTLEVLRPEGFRSRVEKFGMLVAWRTGQGGAPELKPTRMPRDDAVALMATTEARELLPPIASVLRCPVLIEPEPGRVEVLGKGYRHSLICALYGEIAYLVTARQGGVGSVDESFASALMAGRPFICLDNFRGRLDSQHLEAFLTCPGLFPARIPHRGEVLLDPRRFLLQITSNGLEATRDLVNRASICRIFKRPNYTFHRP